MSIPSGLVNAVKQRQAVLFAGAGISYNALKVGGLELRNWVGAEKGALRKNLAEAPYSLGSSESAFLA